MAENPYEAPGGPVGYTPEHEPKEEAGESAGAVAYGVVVRSLGLLSLGYGGWHLSMLLAYAGGLPESYEGDRLSSFISGMFLAVVGILSIGLAKTIVAISYPR